MITFPQKKAPCDVNVSPPDLEVLHASSASVAFLSAFSHGCQTTPPAHPSAPNSAGRGSTRTHCLGRSCPSRLEFTAACPAFGTQSSPGAQVATPLAKDPFAPRCPQIGSTPPFFLPGSCTG